MRVLRCERFEFRIPALELEVAPTQFANLRPEPLDLCL
jgi:hypothetical protein